MKIDFNTNNLIAKNAYDNAAKTSQKDFDKVLEQALKEKDNQKLHDTCVELESVFLAKVFETMRASIPRSDLISRGFAEETFESMLYDEYAKEISKSNSTGIAEILYRQLKNNS